MDGHDHGDNAPHDHSHDHGHTHDHDHHQHEAGAALPDASAWLASTQKLSCPACGAVGALSLGGGVFCPTCGEVTTNPGYQPPASAPEPK